MFVGNLSKRRNFLKLQIRFYQTLKYHIFEGEKIDTSNQPEERINPFKRQPTKIIYDRTEYSTFFLPSEQTFLFSGKYYLLFIFILYTTFPILIMAKYVHF